MERATAQWLAERGIETELRGPEFVAWIPPEHLSDFYNLVYGDGDLGGIKGEIVLGGEFFVDLTSLDAYI